MRAMGATKRWLEKDAAPVSIQEFKAMWDSCTEAEKLAFGQTSAKMLGVEFEPG